MKETDREIKRERETDREKETERERQRARERGGHRTAADVLQNSSRERERLRVRERVFTKELRGVGASGGLLVVGQALVDDLPHGCVQTLQLLVLGRHGGRADGRTLRAGTQQRGQRRGRDERVETLCVLVLPC